MVLSASGSRPGSSEIDRLSRKVVGQLIIMIIIMSLVGISQEVLGLIALQRSGIYITLRISPVMPTDEH